LSSARFLGQLRETGIELRAEGDKLVVNAPKGAVTAELGDEIRRRKPELLAFLRMGAEASTASPSSGRIPRAEGSGSAAGVREAPASFGQRRLFYLDQLEPGLAVYNVPVAFWLSGVLDPEVLRQTLAAIVTRHSVLRTTLRLAHDGVRQQIAALVPPPLDVIDLRSEQSPELQRQRCRELLGEHACKSFDLVGGPLLRTVLIQLGPSANVLLVNTHHVVTDGWSQDIFQAELLSLYESTRKGVASTLPALPIEYADYAIWQTAHSDDADRQKRLQFWRDTLRQPLPILELPTAHARPKMAPTRGGIASVQLPADLIEPLTAIGRQGGATLFMVLLAGYATLLSRIAGQTDVVIGTPIANRTHGDTLDVIGYFANTLALRVDMSGRPTFRELLRRTREVCLGAYANQDVPFEELVESLAAPRDLSRSPIFQTIFAFEDAMPAASRGDGSSATALQVGRRETIHAKVARTDLSAWVSASGDGLLVTFEFPTALFDVEAVDRLLDHFHVLLRAIAGGAEDPIDQLPLLSAEERRRILAEWNDTSRAPPAVAGAHQLIERQVDQTPNRTAVVCGSETLSYRALEEQANQLAHHLVSLGAGPASKIGIFLERSTGVVVALLAVLKTGASYVPLDPEYPSERVSLMIEDSALRLVLTNEALRDRLPAGTNVALLDGLTSALSLLSTDRPAWHEPGGKKGEPSDRPCYVIYTSGSTGRPKGVEVPHRALINLLASMAVRPGMSADDSLLAVTTLSFDIAGLEMFLPLTLGAKLVIAVEREISDGDELRALLERSSVTVMQATPTTWRMLVTAGWRGKETFKILCGGEAFPPELAEQLLERSGSVWNMYGPTETTIWSTCVALSPGKEVTIGRPIDNTAVYVLDLLGEPVPVGVPGELFIGGLGVARGYLNRPELTDTRFVDDKFSSRAGARMYKTGDLVSFRADGELVYHRRLDHQVKVRGHRIELGEIEAALAEHEAVAASVVIVREDRPGDVRLVGYTAARPGHSATATDLRKHLRRSLPEFMIPQHFVELDVLPLTPAGKIARAELPAPAGASPKADARNPETPAERVIATIWKGALGIDSLSATDNFFDLGGHSLLSMVVMARIQSETGTRISARDLLLSSLEQIAAQLPIASARAAEAEPGTPRTAATPAPPAAGRVGDFVSRLKGRFFS